MRRTLRITTFISVLFLATVLLTVANTPTAFAQIKGAATYTGEYYNNISLSGVPTLVRDDAGINFNWGSGSPDPSIPSDNFSVRWKRWYQISGDGDYTFTMTTDDGSRLLVDGALVIDMWYDHAPLARAVTVHLTGPWHTIQMDYYEHTGGALAQLQIQPAGTFPDWKGEYFNNQYLSGSPTLTVNNTAINFNWGTGSPDPSIPVDHFSVRWTRNQYFDAGTYRFTVTTDDGMRVWVGSTLLIDKWFDQSATTYAADITLTAGTYPLRIEYYENTGFAVAMVSWSPSSGGGGGLWAGQYYDNPNLTGTPRLYRNDSDVNFDWGTGGPGGGIPGTNFSVKWDATLNAPSASLYKADVTADDGVRVWVDGSILIDQWHDQPPTHYTGTAYLGAGLHNWHVEYFQHLGGAKIVLQITSSTPPPPPSGDIIVDDGSSSWVAGGIGSSWRGAGGYGGHSYWTFNNTFTQQGYNWGNWYPSLPQSRNYEVFAYIPAGVASTRNARYWIVHAGFYSLRSIPQAYYGNQWVSLGTYYFNAGGGQYVSLSDITYECYLCYTLVWDAVKFSPR